MDVSFGESDIWEVLTYPCPNAKQWDFNHTCGECVQGVKLSGVGEKLAELFAKSAAHGKAST